MPQCEGGGAVLIDHGGGADALKEADPRMFQDAPRKHTDKTGLFNARTATDESKQLKCWEKVADLADNEQGNEDLIMANSIAYVKNYMNILDRVCQRASVPDCLISARRMMQARRNAKEIYMRIEKSDQPGHLTAG